MKFKEISLTAVLIMIILLTLSNVSAADNNTEFLEVNQDLTENIIHSDSSWNSFENTINNADDNSTIYINNTNLKTNPFKENNPITINKNLTIVGKNTIIDANGNSNLFIINSTVKFINITFIDSSGFIINNNINTIIENCTFSNLWENVINSSGNLTITDSKFENIKSIYTNPHINDLSDYYNVNGVIYNTGSLTIENSRFNNITFPNIINFNSNLTVKKEGIIYNLNNATILNTTFTNIKGRVINNTGKLNVKNTSFEKIMSEGSTVNVNTATGSHSTERYMTPDGLTIYNSGELIFDNSSITNVEITHDNRYYITDIIKNNGSGIYNSGNTTVINSYFENIESGANGGAVSNSNLLTIINSTILTSLATRGGAVYNSANATIYNTVITECSADLGMGIYNEGNLIINKTTFDKCKDINIGNWDGDVIYNTGNCTLTESTVKNTRIKFVSEWPFIFFGVVMNYGNMNVTKCFFDNNSAESKYYFVTGTYNIYNHGNMNAEYNIFLNCQLGKAVGPWQDNHDPFAYIFEDDATTNVNYNYFDYNKDTYMNYTNFMINQYFVLDIEPEYIPLEINEKANITATLRLDNGKFFTDYNLLPPINITFTINNQEYIVPLTDGKASIEFNQSHRKGSTKVTASLGECVKEITVDIGKEYSDMTVEAENIYYGDDAVFNLTVSGNYTHQPTGDISIYIDNSKYTTHITEGKAQLKVTKLIAKDYNLKIVYEGDRDYFKSIHYQNYTVYKRPTNMTMTIPEIYYGETGIATITLTPSEVANQAYMFINGTQKTVYLKGTTDVKLKNYAAGEYNITVILWNHNYYESSNATAVFKVNKYPTTLDIVTNPINAGENAILNITLGPDEVAGEARLIINDYVEVIYLKNGLNQVTLNNLTGGSYTITVIFEGDKKYASSNATTLLNVKKENTRITAEIINNTLKVTSRDNITGVLDVYVNDEVMKTSIVNGNADLKINFTSAENYIFIYFEGNDYYNYTTCNLTYEYLNLVNLTGYDNTTYNGEITYIITLVNENGYGLSNRTITVEINSNLYNITTDDTGLASLTLTLPVGEYSAVAYYKNLTVKNILKSVEDAQITGMNVKAYSGDDFPYKVTLTDYSKNPLADKEVIFIINGATYKNVTDSHGIAVLNLNLKKGDYTITAKYNNVSASNNITVIDYEKLFARNVVAYENTDFRYNVTLTDSNRNPLSDEEITFTISNKTYTVKTDKNGTASLNLNLNKGSYTIFVIWSNLTRTNNISVIEDAVLTASDVKVYANTGFNYTASLKDHYGNALAEREVKLIINNRAYTQKTDSNGIAILNLNLVEGNYTVTVIYNNQTKEGKIEVIEDVHITTHNIKAYANKDFDFTVNLTDHNNNPLKNKEVKVNVGNQKYNVKTDSNGIAILTLSLNNGNYSVTTKYGNASVSNTFVIVEDTYLKGRNVRAYAYTDFDYIVNLTDSNGNGISDKEVTFKLNGKTYKSTTNSEGIATLTLSLDEGNYNITATYNTIEIVNRFEILPAYKLNTRNVLMYYKDGTRFTSIITDLRNNPIANKTIEFSVNGAAYTRTSNNNGEASIALNLNSGSYNITTTYENLTNTNTIVIQSTIKGNDITKFFKNGTQYYATFLDKNGELLRNTDVQFNINGVFYTRKTTEEGIARLNINLHQGTYVLTAINPNTTEMHTNTIKVLPVIAENYDLVKYYKNDSQFTVKILDGNGNPVNSGESVTFNINGVFYTRITDSTGHAKLNINLKPGNYTITTDYNGCKVANQIEVISTLQANDLVKNQSTTAPFQAILYNGVGRPLANKEITFNVNGIQTTKTTNRIGIASVNVNLPVGEYLITSSYDDLSIVNRITINAG